MIRFHHILYVLLCCTMFSACSSEDSVPAEEGPMVTAIVPDKILYVDDEDIDARERVTRSTLAYDKENKRMIFKWNSSDAIGLFNVTSENASVPGIEFRYKGLVSTTAESSTARFSNDDFHFDNLTSYWVAYSPFSLHPDNRESIEISYLGQEAQANGTPTGLLPSTNTTMETEALASSHLGAYDYLISSPVQPQEVGPTNFQFSHVGSTMRLYMQFPEGSFGGKGKFGTVKSLRVLTPNRSNLLVSGATLKINQTTDGQGQIYTVKSRATTDNIELKFKENGTGFRVPDNGYLISYMEFFPTNIPGNTAILHLTIEVDGVKKYFKSKYLTAVNIGSGYIYQWTAKQYEEIIELTATLQSWQDIVSGNISTEE